jgi:acetyl-CoA carboxylase, biotin carboxylase subunit
MLQKVLVANRGEIAVRILRSLREMGIASVAVFSEADRGALHVRRADEAYAIGPAPAAESYLRFDRLIEVAKRSGATGIHPGYGFVSENADFAEACERAGLIFIGPPASAMRAMASKTAARETMVKAGVPVVPGGSAATLDEARRTAQAIGYPLMLKAIAGGGGKGMRRVSAEAELENAFERARSEASKAFGDGTLYIEKALEGARHVEIQVLGDKHGNLVHLYERDCSIQRRHQKVVEETPCPAASDELIRNMGAIAVKGARAVGYHSAGTFEFLLEGSGQFYFLEMNTRLQVEHPITELTTGIDLVREMIRVADGAPLGLEQASLERRGAALECRIYAEDPERGFLPSPGTLSALRAPSGPFVRDDSGVEAGSVIGPHYDPLISKLSVWAPDRERALARMRRALSEYVVAGVRCNLAFLDRVMAHPEFSAGRYDTHFIETHAAALSAPPALADGDREALAAAIAAALHRGRSEPGARATSPWVLAQRSALGRRGP